MIDDENLEEKVSVKYSHEKYCSITGNSIERMEPHVNFITMSMKEEGIKLLKENRGNFNTVKVKDKTGYTYCNLCKEREKTGVRIENKNHYVIRKICGNCFNSLISIAERKLKEAKNKIIHHHKSGLQIIDYSENKKITEKLFSYKPKEKKVETVISIGLRGNNFGPVKTELKNINKLIENLENPEENREFSCKEDETAIRCSICKDRDVKIYKIGTTWQSIRICETCIDSIVSSLRNFRGDKVEFIISRKI